MAGGIPTPCILPYCNTLLSNVRRASEYDEISLTTNHLTLVNEKGECPERAWSNEVSVLREGEVSDRCSFVSLKDEVNWHIVCHRAYGGAMWQWSEGDL